ncbi:MBL fold metallo-hydrolase [Thermoflavimicrobium dichotomicum]|uniref:L-ascorbate metabolism protein UlaG, beta-lactamase superfamily n=1 Tax=Thermoflavimicrobium dichotomicum TaxID=46223 RepID=A0A1I3LLB8_9BACL|nr:MBL fold metallo-hydrolase [Thermoflavimicrobium dichotomicum]SFI85330.1 L-ascorbate metabolism protein UlaG, beta-lactamase superfamily [Thermoflavimicrobium dichotomicum]
MHTAVTITLIVLLILLLLSLAYYLFWIIKKPSPPFKEPETRLSPKEWRDDEVTIGWVGHSTVLINLYGYIILTDPVFGKRVGIRLGRGERWILGTKRHTAPAISIEEIGKVDLILLSHAHMDHFDIPTLRKLARPETKVITPKGTARLLRKMPYGQVMEMADEESMEVDHQVKIKGVPVRHWGNRYPWNVKYGYTGYLIERNGVRIFFPGDTAYTPRFRKLKEEGEIDIAIMPIGAYTPDSFQWAHCTPEQAWKMFQEMEAKWFIPIHWDTFVLSYEPVHEPLERLYKAAGDQADRIALTRHGQAFVYQKQEKKQPIYT